MSGLLEKHFLIGLMGGKLPGKLLKIGALVPLFERKFTQLVSEKPKGLSSWHGGQIRLVGDAVRGCRFLKRTAGGIKFWRLLPFRENVGGRLHGKGYVAF